MSICIRIVFLEMEFFLIYSFVFIIVLVSVGVFKLYKIGEVCLNFNFFISFIIFRVFFVEYKVL